MHSTPFTASKVTPMSINQQSLIPKKNVHMSTDVIDLSAGTNVEIYQDYNEATMNPQEYTSTKIHSSVVQTTVQVGQYLESGMYTNCINVALIKGLHHHNARKNSYENKNFFRRSY